MKKFQSVLGPRREPLLPTPGTNWMQQVADIAAQTVMDSISTTIRKQSHDIDQIFKLLELLMKSRNMSGQHNFNPQLERNNCKNNRFKPYPDVNFHSNNEVNSQYHYNRIINEALNRFMNDIIRFHYVNLKKPIPPEGLQMKIRDILAKRLLVLCPCPANIEEVGNKCYDVIRRDEVKILAEADAAFLEDKIVDKYLNEGMRIFYYRPALGFVRVQYRFIQLS